MSGLGFKDFQVGEVLTSADVDGYLMQQSVMRFADSGARGSALGTAVGTGVPLAEGMVTYLDDVNQVQFYDGTIWRPTGSIVQVQNVVKTDPFSLTSATYTDVTGLTVSITPTRASNKVLALFTIQGVGTIGGTVGFWRAMRDSTAIGVGTDVGSRVAASGGFDVGSNNQGIYSGSLTILDSPATTSEVTYKVQIRNQGSSTVYVNRTEGDVNNANSVRSVSSITLMEVGA